MGVGVKGRAALLPLAWPAPVPALPLLRGVAKPAKPVPVPGPNGRAQSCGSSQKSLGPEGLKEAPPNLPARPEVFALPGDRVGAHC